MSFIINNERVTNVLRTPALNNLIGDLAHSLKRQFEYIQNSPVDAHDFYLAAIKDATQATAAALCRNIGDFDVDEFYKLAGYPGTHPIHKPGKNPFIQRTEDAEVTAIDHVRRVVRGNQFP